MSCIIPLLPTNLQNVDLYKRVDELICLQDNLWTDAEISEYLFEASALQRASLEGSGGILTWYSMESWLEMTEASWETAEYGGGPELSDLGVITPLIPTSSMWNSISTVNGEEFNEDGFQLWSHMLEPYMGTNLIQRILLESLKIDGEVVDWYEDFLPINYYSFLLPTFPGWDKVAVLVETSNLIKNAESKLASLKDSNCKNRLILSHGFLDLDYLSDIYGETYKDAFLCFENISHCVYIFPDYYLQKAVNRYQDGGLIRFWEIFELSDSLYLDWGVANKIYATYSHDHIASYYKVQHLLPTVINNLENDWLHGKTWEDYYDWNGVEINELIRQKVLDTGVDPKWDITSTWEPDLTWTGDLDDWTYHKPGCVRCECVCDPMIIPGYEPGNGISLYKPLVFSKNTSETV